MWVIGQVGVEGGVGVTAARGIKPPAIESTEVRGIDNCVSIEAPRGVAPWRNRRRRHDATAWLNIDGEKTVLWRDA